MKIAYVFPGQGSQTVGMLLELGENYSVFRDVFIEASDHIGFDIWELIQYGPQEKLNQTEFTQVAMLTSDVAVFKLLQSKNAKKPDFMAGHSLGEYAALVCANALSLADGVKVVNQRGKIMQQYAGQNGSMAAIVGLTDHDVVEICKQASELEEQVSPANYNAIGQIVVAGHRSAVERAIQIAENRQARLAKLIPVSVPCHCSLLCDAAVEFANFLNKINFKEPEVEIISNVDLSIYKSREDIREHLAEQLYKPVRWVETIQLLKTKGVDTVIEAGPGKVLTGLIKRIERDCALYTVYDENSLQQALKI